MKSRKVFNDSMIFAIGEIIAGILFIILQGGVINIATIILGIALIAIGVAILVNGGKNAQLEGIIRIAAGVVIIVLGSLFASIVLYILAVLFIIYGCMNLYENLKHKRKAFMFYVRPIFQLVMGCLLFFNQGGTVNWIMIIIGVILVIEGVVDILFLRKY